MNLVEKDLEYQKILSYMTSGIVVYATIIITLLFSDLPLLFKITGSVFATVVSFFVLRTFLHRKLESKLEEIRSLA